MVQATSACLRQSFHPKQRIVQHASGHAGMLTSVAAGGLRVVVSSDNRCTDTSLTYVDLLQVLVVRPVQAAFCSRANITKMGICDTTPEIISSLLARTVENIEFYHQVISVQHGASSVPAHCLPATNTAFVPYKQALQIYAFEFLHFSEVRYHLALYRLSA